jgi:hypothetical protein
MTSQSHRACLKPIIDGGKIMADHNDPNAVNSILSDIDVSAADLYDLFGFPSDDTTGGEKVVIALTFASVPETGVFDTDISTRFKLPPIRGLTFPRKTSVVWKRCSGTSMRSRTSTWSSFMRRRSGSPPMMTIGRGSTSRISRVAASRRWWILTMS